MRSSKDSFASLRVELLLFLPIFVLHDIAEMVVCVSSVFVKKLIRCIKDDRKMHFVSRVP